MATQTRDFETQRLAREEEPLAPDKVETDLFAVASHGSTAGACVSIVNT